MPQSPSNDGASKMPPWQFSLLALLALTTALALYLTFANHYPSLAIGIFAGGGIWAGTLLFVDRVVHVARPRSWALLNVVAWSTIGTLFFFISLSILSVDGQISTHIGDASGVLAASLAGGALFCYFGAVRSFLRPRSDRLKQHTERSAQTLSKPPR